MSHLSEAAPTANTARPSASNQVRQLKNYPYMSPSMINDLKFHIYFVAPCQPPGITGRLDCVTNSAWISWDAAAGADSYFVTAVGAEGSRANCSTSSNTTCEVEDLACGVLYNFSVVAKNSNCESQSSETITLETGSRLLTLYIRS